MPKKLNIFEKYSLSFLGLGLVPKAPGTFGSLGALPLFYLYVTLNISLPVQVLIIVLTTIVSSFIIQKVQDKTGAHDQGWIVVDEVLGMLVAWLFVTKTTVLSALLVFLFFRFFDIVKVWPANIADKRIHNGFGVIADDLVAGLHAGILVFCLEHLGATQKLSVILGI